MAATIMDGKALAAKVKEEVREQTSKMEHKPGLAVVLVGDDPASRVYVNGKRRDCEACGIYSEEYALPAETSQQELLELVETLNGREDIDGILVQLPLPRHLDEKAVLLAIRPDKDVDCFHPFNVGQLMIGEAGFQPCTPAGIMRMLKEYGIDPERIGVIGDSAGGYLVQMLGATNGEKAFDKGDFTNVSSDVQAVCTIYGISDLTSIGEGLDPAQVKVHASPAVTEALLVHGPAFGKSPGGSILSDREKAMNASSLGHIDGSEPPFLIMHGSGDRLVSPMQSAHLAQALRKAGTDVEYVLVEGAGHGDLPWFQKPVIERVVKFFEKRLGSPAKDAAEGNNL